jgi:hypothetical protein
MPKSYAAFHLEDLKKIGLVVEKKKLNLYPIVAEIQPSATLSILIERALEKDLSTEKAKSERIIAPILDELEEINNRSFSTFSGHQFNVDKSLGLMGYCDFILSKKPMALSIEAPIFCIVEAKNENLDEGIAQCIAEMYAAQIFNKKENSSKDIVFGTVTFGLQWKIIQLVGNKAIVDTKIYYLNELPKLLGVLNYIVNQ